MKKAFLIVLAVLLVLLAGSALAQDKTIQDAVDISVNTPVNGFLAERASENYYRFTLPKAGVVTVTFSHDYYDDPDETWRLQILDVNQQEYLWQGYSGKTIPAVTSCQIGLPAGAWYVKVYKGFWEYTALPYTFTVNYEESPFWETESNDVIPSADPIDVNTAYSGAIWKFKDSDYYTFTLPKAGYVDVSFKHGFVDSGSNFWQLWIQNENQQNYLWQGYTAKTISEVTSSKVGLPAGTYYVLVRDGGYSFEHSSLTYTFSVNYTEADDWETEFNNSIPEADPIAINSTFYGSVWNSDDNDFYTFELENNGYITVSFSHALAQSGDSLWRLWILNADSEQYLYMGYPGNVSSETVSPRIGLAAGRYYVQVTRGQYSSDHDAGTYQFSVDFTDRSDWETELNNALASADAITPGKLWNGLLRDKNDADFYTFKMKSAGKVFLRFSHPELTNTSTVWTICLLDSTSKEYVKLDAAGNIPDAETGYLDLPAGTYYVRVTSANYYWSSAQYSFMVCTNQVTLNGVKYTLADGTASVEGAAKKSAESITIPATIKVYGNTYKVTSIEDGAFKGLLKLKKVTVGSKVASIGKKAFMNCTALTTVSGCSGVTNIGASAFQGCKKLAAYDLGSKTKTIGKAAFQSCAALKTVSGGSGLVTVSDSAFQKCTSLGSFTFNSRVNKIGKDAFNGCKNLKKITFKTTKLKESTIGASSFKGISAKAVVSCPKAKLAAYKKILLKRGMKKTVTFK